MVRPSSSAAGPCRVSLREPHIEADHLERTETGAESGQPNGFSLVLKNLLRLISSWTSAFVPSEESKESTPMQSMTVEEDKEIVMLNAQEAARQTVAEDEMESGRFSSQESKGANSPLEAGEESAEDQVVVTHEQRAEIDQVVATQEQVEEIDGFSSPESKGEGSRHEAGEESTDDQVVVTHEQREEIDEMLRY